MNSHSANSSDPPSETEAEIRRLRKGRGINSADLYKRVGPRLMMLARAGTEVGPTLLRHRLASELTACAATLPDDARTAIEASLGLSAETRQFIHFTERIEWLASKTNFVYRTALRRVDDAERLLAEAVDAELDRQANRIPIVPHGWFLSEFRAVLRMDTPTPEAHERRRIVASQDNLGEIVAWLNLPRDAGLPRPTLAVEVLFGGRLTRVEQTNNRFVFMIQLPERLRRGQEHEYGLILRVPEGEPMRPHYIFTPECRCDLFDLRVRFSPENRPRWVRRVTGETVRTFDDPAPERRDELVLDATEEVHVRFHKPTMYLGYGVQWTFREQPDCSV